nr:universal stress protein [Fundidesulfovibrio soli]
MNVLVAHDGSVQAAKALDVAIRIAGGLGGKVDIVTVVPDLCLATEELSNEDCDLVASSLNTEARGLMKKVSDALASKGIKAEIVIKNGRPAEAIVEAARELKSELIVVGSHGKHGAAKMFLGSVSSRVAGLADVNTLIVK